ncbi:MAG: T9SS type A sorting domain-containing protein [Crocinitomicaceae bacterium]
MASVDSEELENQIQIYPNPVKDQLIISLKSNKEKYAVQLFDATGKLVLETRIENQQNYISMSQLTSGVYILRVQNDQSILKIERIVKEE